MNRRRGRAISRAAKRRWARHGRARCFAAYGRADVAQAVNVITALLFADAYNRQFVARESRDHRAIQAELADRAFEARVKAAPNLAAAMRQRGIGWATAMDPRTEQLFDESQDVLGLLSEEPR